MGGAGDACEAGADVEDAGDWVAGDRGGRHGGLWTFTAKSLTRLALLPVGYADGLRRAASSGVGDGWVRIGDGGLRWRGGCR